MKSYIYRCIVKIWVPLGSKYNIILRFDIQIDIIRDMNTHLCIMEYMLHWSGIGLDGKIYIVGSESIRYTN